MKKFFFISSLVVLTLVGCDNDGTTPLQECSTPATVRNFTGVDGCGYVFELNDGTIIEPSIIYYCATPPFPKESTEDPLLNFNWIDGKKVLLNYDSMEFGVSICMVGKKVKISCIQDLEPNKACIQYSIDKIKKEDVRNPPAKVYQYTYRGSKVYFIPQYCCDIPSVLLDENCNVICSPDGGLVGNGDGNCANFFKERKKEKLIWKDEREETPE